jgi:hypothetical protein
MQPLWSWNESHRYRQLKLSPCRQPHTRPNTVVIVAFQLWLRTITSYLPAQFRLTSCCCGCSLRNLFVLTTRNFITILNSPKHSLAPSDD